MREAGEKRERGSVGEEETGGHTAVSFISTSED